MAYLAFTGNAYQRLLMGMSNIAVTRDAGKHLPSRLIGKHQMDKIAVAIQTRMQRDPAIAWFNLYGFVEVACGKGEGMNGKSRCPFWSPIYRGNHAASGSRCRLPLGDDSIFARNRNGLASRDTWYRPAGRC